MSSQRLDEAYPCEHCSNGILVVQNLVVLELSDSTLAQLLEVNDMLLATLTQWEATASCSLKHVTNPSLPAHNTAGQSHGTISAQHDPDARAQPGLLAPEGSMQAQSEGMAVAGGARSGGWHAGGQPLPQRNASSMAKGTDAWAQLKFITRASAWAAAILPSQPATSRPVLSEAEFSNPPEAQQGPIGWQDFDGQKADPMAASIQMPVGQPYVHASHGISQSAAVPTQPESKVRPVLSETDFSQLPAARFPPSSWSMSAAQQQGLTGPSLPSSLPTPFGSAT